HHSFVISAPAHPHFLHPFPTRRSSDLFSWTSRRTSKTPPPSPSTPRCNGLRRATPWKRCWCTRPSRRASCRPWPGVWPKPAWSRSEEHTSELQSRGHLVCRLLLEKKKQ